MSGYLKGNVVRAGLIGGAAGAVVLLLSLVPIVGLCFSLVAWVVFAGTGALAALWSKAAGVATTLQQGAIDGAIAGGIAGLAAHAVKWIADAALLIVFGVAMAGGDRSAPGEFVVSLLVNCVGVIGGLIVAIVLGAVGGLIYNAVQQQNKPSV